jgi:hypothetical protein
MRKICQYALYLTPWGLPYLNILMQIHATKANRKSFYTGEPNLKNTITFFKH